jgi:hypothetical protein
MARAARRQENFVKERSMETDYRRQKLDLVWASVFLTAFAVWGLTALVSSGGSDLLVIAVVATIGLFFSIVTVPLLLFFGGNGLGLLIVGRILVFLQTLCLAASVVLCLIAMIANG